MGTHVSASSLLLFSLHYHVHGSEAGVALGCTALCNYNTAAV